MERDLFTRFQPDADALVARLSRNIDDAMLEHIALNDPVGSFVAVYLEELREIRDDGIAPKWPWESMEAVEFATYEDPDSVTGAWHGVRGHWARAFAAALLLRAYGDDEIASTCTGVYYPRLMTLLESLRSLDAGLEIEAMASLAWLVLRIHERDSEDSERIYFGLGILDLAVRCRNFDCDASIVALCEWLVTEEKRLFQYRHRYRGESYRECSQNWLLRADDPLNSERWVRLGARLAASTRTGRSGDAARSIGRLLSGEARPNADAGSNVV
ncbi:MAG: hypothetical protein AB7V13_09440 [Pseudorhodoplanes sp.]|uniref:hypothetical protein n=1 Tax=Pseudorhodoplanes sp. TaxID=1934341 RepID=UPI003D0EC6C3